MSEYWTAAGLLFLLVFGFNVAPAFVPPTWVAIAFVGLTFPGVAGVPVALTAALAATLGRLTLAKASRWLVRGKLMGESYRRNVDVIRERLEQHRTATFGGLLGYALSPLPSNLLFVAYGLTSLPLARAALPFFLGRAASYSVLITTAAAAGRAFAFEPFESFGLATASLVLSQLALVPAIYAFARVDWRALLSERRLRWVRR